MFRSRLHFKICYTASQCFSRLFEEIDGSRADWPVRRPAAIAIDQAPQSLEHVRQTINFVEDDEFVTMTCKIKRRFR